MEVGQRDGQAEVRVVPDMAARRRASRRVWSCLESVDGGSGGMSTRKGCCVRAVANGSAGRKAADEKLPEKSAGARLSPPEAGPRN